MNLLLKMEMIREGRGIRLPMIMLFYNSILAFTTILFMFFNIESAQGGIYFGGVSFLYQFIVISTFQIVFTLIVIPFVVLGSFEEEKEKHIFDQIMLIPIVPRYYVLSKILLILLVNALLYVSSLPIIALSCIYSGVSLFKLFRLGFMVLLFSTWLGSLAVFCFCVVEKIGGAFSFVISGLFAFTIGNMILIELIRFGSMFVNQTGTISPIASKICLFLMSMNPLFDYLGYLGNLTGDAGIVLNLCSRINVDAGAKTFAFLFYKLSVLMKLLMSAGFLLLAVWKLENFTNRENDLYN